MHNAIMVLNFEIVPCVGNCDKIWTLMTLNFFLVVVNLALSMTPYFNGMFKINLKLFGSLKKVKFWWVCYGVERVKM